ncbi:MAG: hypothetical protein E4H01_09755, partial [Lysobacterales bacterium]
MLNINNLKDFAKGRFEKQYPVLSLWQELAEHFYPERNDFLRTHFIGEEMSDNLANSQPLLIRRELANSLEAMLRDGDWFSIGIEGEPDHAGKMWLEWASQRLMMMINQRNANFRRATKESDNDYVTFGQFVMSVELNRKANGLLFRNWHMKNVCWWDDDQGQVGGTIRKEEMELHQMASYYGKDSMPEPLQKKIEKTPFKTAQVYHFDFPSEMYGDGKYEQFARVQLSLELEHDHILEIGGANIPRYIVPRFQTIAGSPYAYSPATVIGLPDARTLQTMTHTLLEAGERHARPPIIATEGVIRGDANLYPDGITFVSEDYDERTGASLRPLIQDAKGFPFGQQMQEGIVEVLKSAFYVNKINMPDVGREMTAYEVSERMKQFRRENRPLFAPIEHEYSGRMCELAFEVAMRNGFLGSPDDIPDSLKGRDVIFRFESPLTQADEEKKVNQFQLVAQLLASAAEADPGVINNGDIAVALRDAVDGSGAPEKWLRDLGDVKKLEEMQQQQLQ